MYLELNMTNEKLQQKVLEVLKPLGTLRAFYNGDTKNPFEGKLGRKYTYAIARGKFDKCGKHGLLIMKNYFRELELNKHIDKSFEQYDQVYKNLKDK